ncbi:MAG: DUF5004 domain-containing protein [Sphingobacteriaceae bacterium]|nr:DUF5004 domain-containing protein [Sphingobacteriaceae bacterium]
MKHFRLLPLLFIILVFSNCAKDDDSNVKAKLIGKWKLIQERETEYEDGVKVNEDLYTEFEVESAVEFKSDGKLTFTEGNFSDDATYTVNLSGTKLTIDYRIHPTAEVDIKSLTSSELILVFANTDTQNGLDYKKVTEASYKKR